MSEMVENQYIPKSIKEWTDFIQAPSYVKRIVHFPFGQGIFVPAQWENIRFGLQGRFWHHDGSIFPIHLNAPGGTIAVTDGHVILVQKEGRPDTEELLIKFAGAYVPLNWTEGVLQAYFALSDNPISLEDFPEAHKFFEWVVSREFAINLSPEQQIYMVSKVSGWPNIVFASILGVVVTEISYLRFENLSINQLLEAEQGIYSIGIDELPQLIHRHLIGCNNSNALAQRIALFGFPK